MTAICRTLASLKGPRLGRGIGSEVVDGTGEVWLEAVVKIEHVGFRSITST